MTNDKKLKRLRSSDGTIEVSIPTENADEKKEMPFYIPISTELLNDKDERPFHRNGFIHLQGKESIKCKMERGLSVGDCVMLIHDYPDDLLFKGYVCMIIFAVGTRTEPFYEIEFVSSFDEDDRSRQSKKENPGLKFPQSNYIATVPGEHLVRLETQDLFYRTSFN